MCMCTRVCVRMCVSVRADWWGHSRVPGLLTARPPSPLTPTTLLPSLLFHPRLIWRAPVTGRHGARLQTSRSRLDVHPPHTPTPPILPRHLVSLLCPHFALLPAVLSSFELLPPPASLRLQPCWCKHLVIFFCCFVVVVVCCVFALYVLFLFLSEMELINSQCFVFPTVLLLQDTVGNSTAAARASFTGLRLTRFFFLLPRMSADVWDPPTPSYALFSFASAFQSFLALTSSISTPLKAIRNTYKS